MIEANLTEDQIDKYTNGDCYVLAKHLADKGVGELVAVVATDDYALWSHMAVRVSPDSYLDAIGIMSAEELIEEYSRSHRAFRIMELLPEEYDELVEGQAAPMDSEEVLEEVAHELIEWVESVDAMESRV